MLVEEFRKQHRCRRAVSADVGVSSLTAAVYTSMDGVVKAKPSW